MADDSKMVDALTALVEKATGKDLKARTDWANYKRPSIPAKVKAGSVVISDQFGNNAKVTELFHMCEGGRGATCNPVEGRTRGPMVIGALHPQIKGGELVIHQYTPYPQFRDDGMPHVNGSIAYPHIVNPTGWQEVAGTYYNRSSALGAEWMKAAQAAAAPAMVLPSNKESKNA